MMYWNMEKKENQIEPAPQWKEELEIFCEGQELRVAKAAACHADGIEKGEKI